MYFLWTSNHPRAISGCFDPIAPVGKVVDCIDPVTVTSDIEAMERSPETVQQLVMHILAKATIPDDTALPMYVSEDDGLNDAERQCRLKVHTHIAHRPCILSYASHLLPSSPPPLACASATDQPRCSNGSRNDL